MSYPIEALLRPPVEAWTAVVAGVCALICLMAPWALLAWMLTNTSPWLLLAISLRFASRTK